MILFSFLYTFLDDNHFAGVNKFQEIVKEEVIKDKAKKEITENFENIKLESFGIEEFIENYDKRIEEKAIDETTKKTEESVKNTDLNADNVQPSIYNKYLNRLYFSIITGCLLGYGDIYPTTFTAKLLCSLQGLTTVGLIIS
jgi:vacuolar-type H+-ATPase subunit I/STV1